MTDEVKDGGAAGRCSTCANCQSPEMFAKDPRPSLPICGKFMLIFRGEERFHCAGWEPAYTRAETAP